MSFYNGILNHEDNHESGQIGQRGLPGIGFKVDSHGNYDIENKKLTNVQNGDMDNDVMVKSQIEGYVSNKTQYLDGVNPGEVKPNKAAIYSSSGGLHGNSFYIKDRYGQEVKLHTEDQDDNQIRLYIPNLKNNDSFGGRPKSSIMITSIDQSIQGKKLFHNIEVPTPTSDTQASNKKYVDTNFVAKSGDTMLGPLVVQKDNYPIQGDLNKVISYETQREIFLSKKEGGKMEQAIDMNGFSIDNLPIPTDPDHACNKYYIDYNFLNRLTGGQIGGDLDMRGHSIKYLKLDNSDHAAARVAELNLKADKSDLDDYLKLDGSRSLIGDLNMNGNRILNLPSPIQGSEPTNKEYISKNYLDLRGDNLMDGDLRLNGYRILGLSNIPENNYEASNNIYVDNSISKAQIKPSHIPKNALKYIMDDIDQTTSEYGIEIDKIDNLEASFHSYNKRVIYLKLLKDENDYISRIGYNIYQLVDKNKDRFYTAVIEWLSTDNNVWDKMEIFNNITSGSIISNQTRKFEDGEGLYYTRSIIQFEVMAISTAPLYLLSTIHIEGVNPTYPSKFNEVFNIIYGCNGRLNHVDPDMIYDAHQAFEIDKNRMKMLVPLDMNNKAIKNISNLSMEGLISVYGTVDRSKYFIASNVNVPLNFRKIHISYIRIYGTHETRSKSDTLKIEDRLGNENWYPFRFHHIGGMVHIGINRYFEVIRSIKLTNTTNIAFQISYAFFLLI